MADRHMVNRDEEDGGSLHHREEDSDYESEEDDHSEDDNDSEEEEENDSEEDYETDEDGYDRQEEEGYDSQQEYETDEDGYDGYDAQYEDEYVDGYSGQGGDDFGANPTSCRDMVMYEEEALPTEKPGDDAKTIRLRLYIMTACCCFWFLAFLIVVTLLILSDNSSSGPVTTPRAFSSSNTSRPLPQTSSPTFSPTVTRVPASQSASSNSTETPLPSPLSTASDEIGSTPTTFPADLSSCKVCMEGVVRNPDALLDISEVGVPGLEVISCGELTVLEEAGEIPAEFCPFVVNQALNETCDCGAALDSESPQNTTYAPTNISSTPPPSTTAPTIQKPPTLNPSPIPMQTSGPTPKQTPSPTSGPTISPAPTTIPITSCSQNVCGRLSECWELNNGDVSCQCQNGTKIDFYQDCPVDSVICQRSKVFDLDLYECVCPPATPKPDRWGFCFANGSPCLSSPCTGVGSTCHDMTVNGTGSYECRCSDDSIMLDAQNCDFATIKDCEEPFPCGIEATCFEEQDRTGSITDVGCECKDLSIVDFGVSCVLLR